MGETGPSSVLPSYWVVDPLVPSMTVSELERPFGIEVVPTEPLRD